MRFIEWMLLDADQSWRSDVVSQEEIVAAVGAEFRRAAGPPLQPAERFAYRDGKGEIGVIPSVTRPFCGLRGQHPAHGRRAVAVVPVRGGRGRPAGAGQGDGESSDDDVAGAVQRCVAARAGYMIGQVTFVRPCRSMSQDRRLTAASIRACRCISPA